MARSQLWLSLFLAITLGACKRKSEVAPPTPPPPAPAQPALDPEAAEARAILLKMSAVFSCFERRMYEASKTSEFELYTRTSFTDLFVFDRVFGDRETIKQSPEALCEAVVKDYQAAFRTMAARLASLARAGRPNGSKPPPIDVEPEFIRASRGRTALHVLKHGDITREVLLEMNGGRVRPVFEAVTFGAQHTDVYRWADLRFHAQTNPHEPHERTSENETSQAAFVGGVMGLIDRVREEIHDGNFGNAGILLGVACHAAQDLVFHHGITRRQLAGLRFFQDRDHYGSESDVALREAKRWTKEIVSIAQQTVRDRKAWERFLAWKPPADFNLNATATAVFRDDPSDVRLSIVALTRNWLPHLRYRHSPEARAELAEGPGGLIRWDAPALFKRLRESAGTSEVAVRRDRR
jgi:hypothetical protein